MGLFKQRPVRFTIRTALMLIKVYIDLEELRSCVLREIILKEKEVAKELGHGYHPPEIIEENIADRLVDSARKSVRLTVKMK